MMRTLRLKLRRFVNTAKVLRVAVQEALRAVDQAKRPQPLLAFFKSIQHAGCHCRACDVAFTALHSVEASRIVLPAGRAGSTPVQEADGLMRAALVVLLQAHSTVDAAGVRVVDGATVMRTACAALGAAFEACHVPVRMLNGHITTAPPAPMSTTTH